MLFTAVLGLGVLQLYPLYRSARFIPYTCWPTQLQVQPRVAMEADCHRYVFRVFHGLLSRMDKLKKRIVSQRKATYEAWRAEQRALKPAIIRGDGGLVRKSAKRVSLQKIQHAPFLDDIHLALPVMPHPIPLPPSVL